MKLPSFPMARLAAAALLTLIPVAAQAKPGWTDNQSQALAQAKAEKKLVLMDFTGSDWCPWCVKLDKEVFSTPEFKDYAKDHLVLLELDFPNTKTLPPRVKQQNDALQAKYSVENFPTLIVVDGDGKPVKAFSGYPEGGVKELVAELKKLKS